MMVAIPELDGATCRSCSAAAPTQALGAPRPQRHGSRTPSAPTRWPRAWRKLVALRRTAAGRAQGRDRPVQLPAQCRRDRHRRLSRRCSNRSTHTLTRAGRATATPSRCPADVDALRDAVLDGNAARFGADANVARPHPRRRPCPPRAHLARDRGAVGSGARAASRPTARSIHVLGARFGNVFVGVQPAFGYEGDPMRLLFEKGFAPTHAFSAFYRWLREDFGAHAVLHFGTHGALEFMPGKQAGLSAACWPDRLIGDLPNFYLYAANNPSEGMIAKRRGGGDAGQLPHPAGGPCRALPRAARPQGARSSAGARSSPRRAVERGELAALIQAQAAAVDLAAAEPAWATAPRRSRAARRRDPRARVHADPARPARGRRAARRRGARARHAGRRAA